MHFNFVDIRLLVHIAETGSLTKGANLSNLSLPSASKRVKNFEEDVGLKLLYRTSHGITLTPVGQVFLRHARMVIQQLEALRGDLEQYQAGIKGDVRIYANATTISESLAAVLPAFIVKHPGINIELEECWTAEILRATIEGKIDIGIVAGYVPTEGLEALPYREERLVLVTSVDHELAGMGEVAFDKTLKYDHVSLQKESAMHGFLAEAASQLDQALNTRMHLGNCDAVCRMVEAKAGVAIVPYAAASRHVKTMAIRLIPLSDKWAFRQLHIVVRSMDLITSSASDLIDLLTANATLETAS